MKATTALLLSLLACPAMATDSPTVPFALPTPEGWRTETIAFPLEFAPEIGHEGIEELRFAPGMVDPNAADFWTYAFVWWIADSTPVELERLTEDLQTYYRGLTNAVAARNQLEAPDLPHRAELERSSDPSFLATGRLTTVDAFVTREPIELDLRIASIPCAAAHRQALFFAVSPQSEEHPVWQSLEAIRTGFRCEDSAGATSARASDETLSNTVRWSTASEVDNFGFHVYRGSSQDGPFERLNADIIEGGGTSDEPREYRWVDDTIDPTKDYWYYVESVSFSGEKEQFTPIGRAKAKRPVAPAETEAPEETP